MKPPPDKFSIGDFRLDPANECLWRGSVAIPLRPKAFALLRYFCDNPGRILTKDELLDVVWGEAVVGDSVLKVCVRELRKILGDPTGQPRFIETVHRRGYRFRGAAQPSQKPSRKLMASVSTRELHSSLVGREGELVELRRQLAAASEGERRIVFLSGGPGIGKTALLSAFLGELEPSEALWIAHGQCLDQFGTGEAYLPILDALSRLAQGAEREALGAALRERAPTWAAQLPWVLSTRDRESLESELFGATQARMLREILEVWEFLTLARTLIFCLEDMHWADPSTVELLAAFGRRTARARVLLLCTVRPVDLILSEHPLKRVKRELEGRQLSAEIRLSNLDLEQCQRFAEDRLGGGLPERLTPWAHGHTDGNPLFLAHLLDSLRERGVVASEGDEWRLTRSLDDERVPESVLFLLDAMVDRRSEGEQRALEAASVAGAEFSSAAVAAILMEPQAQVEALLDGLAEAGFFIEGLGPYVLPDGTPTQRYRFIHALHSAALLHRLPAARSQRFHARNAQRGVEAYGERVAEVAGEVAREYELGGRPHQAVRFLREAANECIRRYAVREACGHLERALVLCDSIDGDERMGARLEVLEALGLARRTGGDMLGAAEAFDGMALQAGAMGRSADVVRARLFEASAASWHDRERCLDAIAAAGDEGGALTDGVLLRHAAGMTAYWRLLWESRREADAQACETARSAAFAAGERTLEGAHSVRLAWFHWLGGRYRESVAMAREGVALSVTTGDFFDYLLGQYFLAWGLLHSGAWGELRRVLHTAQHMAERNGHESWAVLFRLLEAWLHFEACDFASAREKAMGAREQAVALGHAYPSLLGDTILGLAYFGTGDNRAACEHLNRVRGEDSKDVLMGWTLRMIASSGWARAEFHRGAFETAAQEARAVVATAEASGERTAASLGRRTLAQVAARAGEDERARQEIQAALAHLEGELAPLAAWRVHAAASDIFEASDPDRAARHRRASIQSMEALANSLDAGDPLRETLFADQHTQDERIGGSP